MTADGSTAGDARDITFEAAVEELGRIVDELDGGRLDLGPSLERYARGVDLLNRCQSLLDGAERTVALLTGVAADGTPETAPFDAGATVEPAVTRGRAAR